MTEDTAHERAARPAAPPRVVARQLSFSYPDQPPIYRDLNLELGPGLHLLLGANGVGKSSLMRVLAGVEQPTSGSVEIDGFDLWRHEVEARSRLAYVPEVPDMSAYATVREILRLVARLRAASEAEASDAAGRFGLSSLGGRTTRELSLGQRRRILLAAAWIRTPDLLLLDEPLDGVDQEGRNTIDRWLEDLVGRGATVLVSSHELAPFRSSTESVLWHDGSSWRHDQRSAGRYTLEQLEELALGKAGGHPGVNDRAKGSG